MSFYFMATDNDCKIIPPVRMRKAGLRDFNLGLDLPLENCGFEPKLFVPRAVDSVATH